MAGRQGAAGNRGGTSGTQQRRLALARGWWFDCAPPPCGVLPLLARTGRVGTLLHLQHVQRGAKRVHAGCGGGGLACGLICIRLGFRPFGMGSNNLLVECRSLTRLLGPRLRQSRHLGRQSLTRRIQICLIVPQRFRLNLDLPRQTHQHRDTPQGRFGRLGHREQGLHRI